SAESLIIIVGVGSALELAQLQARTASHAQDGALELVRFRGSRRGTARQTHCSIEASCPKTMVLLEGWIQYLSSIAPLWRIEGFISLSFMRCNTTINLI